MQVVYCACPYRMESLVHAVLYQVGLGTVLEVVDAETLPANVDLLQTPQKLCL